MKRPSPAEIVLAALILAAVAAWIFADLPGGAGLPPAGLYSGE